MGLKARFLWILIPSLMILFGILSAVIYRQSTSMILKQVNREANEMAHSNAREFDILFGSSQKVAEGISSSLVSVGWFRQASVKNLIMETLVENPGIYGASAAFNPSSTSLRKFAPYYYRSKDGVRFKSLSSPDYNYLEQDWYTTPMESNKGSWGEPYVGRGEGDIQIVSFSTPIRKDDNIIGIVTVDISINELSDQVSQLRNVYSGFAVIISGDGKLVTRHESTESNESGAVGDVSPPKRTMESLLHHATTGQTDFINVIDPVFFKSVWAITTPIQSTGWFLAVFYPKQGILAPVREMNIKVGSIATMAVGLILILVLLTASGITAPLENLVTQTMRYGKGDFKTLLKQKRGPREIRQLTEAFNHMGKAIEEQIEKIRRTTAQKQSYEQELRIASEIQLSILPTTFPPFPELDPYFDIYGMTHPAKEVGGDFYDMFKVGDDRIAIVVADVSDKGAPSSFFMAMSRLLVREVAERGFAPAEILRRVNYSLERDNKTSMFVTMLYADYNITTGLVRFVCAGHDHPIHIAKDGRVESIPMAIRLPLGLLSDTHYQTIEFTLPEEDALILYTDGITETMNEDGEEFGLNRLENCFSVKQSSSCREIAENLLKSTADFRGEAKQGDDITMLILKRRKCDQQDVWSQNIQSSEDRRIQMTLPANLSILEFVANIVENAVGTLGFTTEQIDDIQLALDEVITNVITHAYSERHGETFLLEFMPLKNGVSIVVIDYGKSFDFEEASARYDGQADPNQAIGGLGLYLVQKTMDSVRYEPHAPDGNRMALVKYFKES